MSKLKKLLGQNTMLVALIVVMVLFQILITAGGKGSLFAPTNISNLIMQNSYVVILATGMLLCILTGGNIDLSVGSIVALIGAIAGVMIVNWHMNIYLAMLLCLLIGVAVGVSQAFWIAYMSIPPFIVTLCGMLIWRGLATIILDGTTISPFPQNYLKYFTSYLPGGSDKGAILVVSLTIGIVCCVLFIGNTLIGHMRKKRKGYVAANLGMTAVRLAVISAVILLVAYQLGQNKGVPVVLVLLAVVVLAYQYFTTRTVPGRHVYALGGNAKATQLSGINTKRVMFGVYINMAVLSAVAALVCVGRFNSAAPSAGTSYEMDAIGACFIGGASAYGGVGTVAGAVIGAIFMGVLNNGMSILGIDANWQKVVKGLVLLGAVVVDVVSKKQAKAA